MVVVGIMGLVMLMGVPIVYKTFHKQAMTKAVTEVLDVCKNARARAILSGQEVVLVIHPREKRLEVSGGGGSGGGKSEPFTGISVNPSSSGLSATLDDSMMIEDLDINLIPGGFLDAEEARVRFFPNGTCDEMRLLLVSDRNQRCEIKLEVTTGIADVEYDVNKFR